MANENANQGYVILSPEGLDMNAGLPPVTDKAVIKAIKDSIGGDRKTHDTVEKALESLTAGMEKTNSYAGLPVIMYREDAFTGNQAVVATVGVRVKESKNEKGETIPAINGIKAILVFPQPSIDSFIEDEQGKNWLAKLAEREAADVGFSGIRSAESVLTLCNAVDRMPVTIETITAESRANSIDTTIFDEYWQGFKEAFTAKNPAFAADGMFPQKPLWLKAIRSKPFAMEHAATRELETRGFIVKIANLFVNTLKAATNPETGEALNLDTSIIEGWLADREKVSLSAGAKPDVNALDSITLDLG